MSPLDGPLGPGARFWQSTGFWTATVLLVLSILVPGSAELTDLEERRRRARGLVWAGAGALLAFHGWGALRFLDYLEEIRRLGPSATARDHALGLVFAGRASFCGWACFGMSVLFAGFVLRGNQRGRWVPWALLLAIGVAVAIGLASFPAVTFEGEPILPVTQTWEATQGFLAALAGLAALLVGSGAAIGLLRGSRERDPAAFDRARLRLAGAGMVLLSAAFLLTLVKGFTTAVLIEAMGPKLLPADVRAFWISMATTYSPFALAGLLAAATGMLLRHGRREGLDHAAPPGVVGDTPTP